MTVATAIARIADEIGRAVVVVDLARTNVRLVALVVLDRAVARAAKEIEGERLVVIRQNGAKRREIQRRPHDAKGKAL